MDCKETKEKMVDLRDGVLDSFAMKAVTEHLLTCKDCSAELQALKNTDELLEKWPGLSPSGDFEDILHQKIDAGEAKAKKMKKSLIFLSVVAVAAVIAVFVYKGKMFTAPAAEVILKAAKVEGKVVIVSGGLESELTAESKIKEGDVLKAGYRSGADITITENSTIRLREDSRVSIGKSREQSGAEEYSFELFAGELLARVNKKGEALNFTVKTPNAAVSAAGAAFKIAVTGEHATSVLVSDGTVNAVKTGTSSETCSVAAGSYIRVAEEESFLPEVLGKKESTELEELDTLKGIFVFPDESESAAKKKENEKEMKEEKESEPPEKIEKTSSENAAIAKGWVKGIISGKDDDNTWVQMDSTAGSSKKYVWPWGDKEIVKKISVLKAGDKVIIRWYVNDRLRIKDIGVVKFK